MIFSLVVCLAVALLLAFTDYRIFDCYLCGKTKFGKKITYTVLGTELVICRSCQNNAGKIANEMGNQFLIDMQQDLSDMFK